jgi:hypothetical protein
MPLSMRRRVQELVRKAADKAGVTIERIVADDVGRPATFRLRASRLIRSQARCAGEKARMTMRSNRGPPMTLGEHAFKRCPRGHGDMRRVRTRGRGECGRSARGDDGPRGGAPSQVQLRREARPDPARVAYGPTSGRARLSAGAPVEAKNPLINAAPPPGPCRRDTSSPGVQSHHDGFNRIPVRPRSIRSCSSSR